MALGRSHSCALPLTTARARALPALPTYACTKPAQKESAEKKQARLAMEALAAKEAEAARVELARAK